MIPRDFVETNLKKAKGAFFFGVPIEKMTREELIACAVAGWIGQEEQRTEHAQEMEFMTNLRR